MEEYTHNIGTFIGKGGVEIFFQSWNVKNPKGIVAIVHGLGEHSGRYANIIEKLKGKGISFYAFDNRGHGRSGGKRGHVISFMEYIYDLKLLISFIKDDHERLPVFILGHSMGGVISLKYALTYPDDINGLIVSSAGLIFVIEVPKWKEAMGNFFSKYIPGLSMPSGLPPEDISRDADVVKAYKNDPLVHDKVSTRWFTEFTSTGEECLKRASELKMPIILFHGTDDRLVDYKGTEKIFEAASSRDKELYIFEGFYHETMNEPLKDRERVLDIVSNWILKRVGKKKAASKAKPLKAKRTPVSAKASKSKKKAASSKKSTSPKKGVKKLSSKKTTVKRTSGKSSKKR